MKILNISLHFAEYTSSLVRGHKEVGDSVVTVYSKSNYINEIGKPPDPAHHADTILIEPGSLRKPTVLVHSLLCLLRIIRQGRPSIVHIQEGTNLVLAGVAFYLRLTSRPYFLTVHDPLPHSGTDSKLPILRILVKKILRRNAFGYVVHGENLRYICVHQLLWTKPILSMPHVSLCNPDLTSKPIPWDTGSILFAGRIEKYKGLGVLIEAMKILQKTSATCKLIVAGRGPDLLVNRSELESIGAEIVDDFLPSAEFHALFDRANVVVMPYIDATQSGIAAMAIGHARPTVASAVGSLPEIVINGFNGVVVPPGNAVELASAILSIIVDGSVAQQYSTNAKELADGAISPRACAQKLRTFYRQCTEAT